MPWATVLTFGDPLPCQAAIQNSRAEILPTARGRFYAELTKIGMNRLWMQRLHISLPQVCTATCGPDRQGIGFLAEFNSCPVQHCGVEVSPGDILIYRSDVIHQRSDANLRIGAMSLPLDEFNAAFKAVVGRDFPKRLPKPIIRPSSALMSRLLKLHKTVGQLAHDTPDILELPEVRRALEEQLIHVMVWCLAEGAGVETTLRGRHHNAIVARFEEFLEANPDRPLYLNEICAGIGIAERTLRTCCEEQLGMGPIRYLTLRRMHLTRRALLRADPSNSTVTRIVIDHGFWELGRFSVAYRALFGESPSETLRRPAEQIANDLNRPSSLAATEFSARLR
jgi:AraC-like DNA-binding protein